VNAASRLTVGSFVTNATNDKEQLLPMMASISPGAAMRRGHDQLGQCVALARDFVAD